MTTKTLLRETFINFFMLNLTRLLIHLILYFAGQTQKHKNNNQNNEKVSMDLDPVSLLLILNKYIYANLRDS